MAKRAKASEPSEPEAGIVKVDDRSHSEDVPPEVEATPAALPAPNEAPSGPPPSAPPPAPAAASSGPSFGQRVGRFFRFLFRLVLLLIALAVIGVALYFVLPVFYETFVRPVERNAAQVQDLQSWQGQAEQELADLQTRLETLETVQNQQDGSLTELDQRLSDIETEIAARTQSLAALEQMQSELQEENESASVGLQRQIDLLKAMELLSRARLFMYQSNFGLAQQDVQIARDVLAEVRPDAPEPQAGELDAVLLRLDMTLSNLPDFPVAASDDLDIAWQILLSGLPRSTPTFTPTPTPFGPASATPDAADITITPTLAATVPASATP